MPKRSLLDRSIVVILPNPDETPTRKHGISAADERLHRMQGTCLIEEASQILQIHDIYPTACVIFHRFFHQVSLRDADVWSIVMAATLLAAKTHDAALPVRSVILAFAHLYRKRTLVLLCDDHRQKRRVEYHPAVAPAPADTAKLTLAEKMQQLQDYVPPMSQLGPVWKEWHDAIVQAESRVLRQLGFTLYWIPDQHPHLFLRAFVEQLAVCVKNDDDDDDSKFTATAWHYCNLSYRLDICVRFAPEVIACAAIHCAALDNNYQLPLTAAGNGGMSWWHVFCGSGHEQDLSTVANAILGLDDETNLDVLVASKAFVKSQLSNVSFNDPDSFLWEMLIERVGVK